MYCTIMVTLSIVLNAYVIAYFVTFVSLVLDGAISKWSKLALARQPDTSLEVCGLVYYLSSETLKTQYITSIMFFK